MDEFKKLISENIPVLVDFYATWCGPCKMMHPILEELKNKVGDKAKIVKIDVDKHQDLAAQFMIQSVPTLIMFKSSQQLWRKSGVQTAANLEKELEKYY